MHIIDEEGCIGCGACSEVCPVDAIAATEEGKYRISDTCINCGACVEVCPVGVISSGE
ncbi:ATP-binding protein [Fusobacterium sp. IOR10]|uniref:ATP-binding protein n=1 Tax=Fusobacterium sp. IOR10 TaxID=2665157 RepID=UPI0013D0E532|nr:4Fe-4S binding protein [Fusobacterium sp. IOR10]